MKKPVFKGSCTAICTPFLKNGEIDYASFGKMIDWQIAEGTQALVVMGTTGENPVISDEEFEVIVKYAIDRVAKRIPVIVGTGRNDTRHSIKLSKLAKKLGGDAILVVTPYYNKSTQRGLVAHVSAIAESMDLPIVLYNVPSRTGISFTAETYAELAKIPNVNGVKEASGNFGLILQTVSKCPEDFYIWSGNDDQIVPIMALGGMGVISVLSNIAPKDTQTICKHFFDGNVKKSAELQANYCDLIDALFVETNPIPVKAALAEMGKCEGTLRLPLVDIGDKARQQLITAMKNHKLI